MDTTKYPSKYPELKKENNIQVLIDGIEIGECIEGPVVGLAGQESRIYGCYKRLCQLASDTLLLKLGDSKSAVLRFYAYQALYSKQSPLASALKKRLMQDNTVVCWRSNDMGLKAPISYFILHLFK